MAHAQIFSNPIPDKKAEVEKIESEKVKPQTLDDLFERLRNAKDEEEATGISRLIERRLAKSGSPTTDLLMRRAEAASASGNTELAVELNDRVLVLEPKWAEAWGQRALFFVALEDPLAAVEDLAKAVQLEPRHYNAWAALGSILLTSEENKAALFAFKKAVEIYPFFPSAMPYVTRLTRKMEGQKI